MKLATLGLVTIGAWVSTACVTEGVVAPVAASEEEQAEANLALGIGYLQEERPDLAIEALERAIEFQPRLATAHSMVAIAYDQTQSSDLAEQHHRRATQLAPRDSIVQNSYAVFLCLRNRWTDAAPYFQRAIDASARNASLSIMMNAAACARGASDLDGAEQFFRAALGIDAANIDALRGMMDVSIRAENYISGRAFWQRLERSAAIEAGDLLSCYVIETELGDESAAGACASRLRREFPGSPALTRLIELERNAG